MVSVGIALRQLDDLLLDEFCATSCWPRWRCWGSASAGAWLINRRLRRQTHGLGEREITRMYEYYRAVLHAVREGLLLIDLERSRPAGQRRGAPAARGCPTTSWAARSTSSGCRPRSSRPPPAHAGRPTSST